VLNIKKRKIKNDLSGKFAARIRPVD